LESVARIKRDKENLKLLEQATKTMQKGILCFKYNYSLDEEVQNFTHFESKLSLSEDCQSIIITNKKIIEKP